jgi:hypothetical protein
MREIVYVSPSDIFAWQALDKAGIGFQPTTNCAVVSALRRHFNIFNVNVDYESALINGVKYDLGLHLTDLLKRIDDGLNVDPFFLTINDELQFIGAEDAETQVLQSQE